MRRVWRGWLLGGGGGVVLILRTEVRHATGEEFIVEKVVKSEAECSKAVLSELRTYLVLNTAMSR